MLQPLNASKQDQRTAICDGGGLKLAERGGKNGKKRAVIATARKLAVLLHRLWESGEVYKPLRNSHPAALPAAA
jgi:transposase